MKTRLLSAPALLLGLGLSLTPRDVGAQVVATCQLNEVENRIYNPVPLEGTLKSTEEQLSPDLPFMQYLPNGYDSSKKWPVILFMHGIGEVGGDLRKVTEHSLPRMVEAPEWDWPFIVLSPVLPTPNWQPRSQLVSDILDYAVDTLGGDPNRIYLTGLSHGGAGTLAVGIELADRVAALMPVTPGGDADAYNWDRRAAIAPIPTFFIIGTLDSEYQNALGWAMDLEGSGAPAFFHYDYPTENEHLDLVPMEVLQHTHVFGSYLGLPHDVWHAAYGTFCDVLTAYKTVQYNWLLQQSLDGSPFVDPRDPNAPPAMGSGGAAAMGGAPAIATAGAPAAAMGGATGVPLMEMGGATAMPVTPPTTDPAAMPPVATAGTTAVGSGMAGMAATTTPPTTMPTGGVATTDSGCTVSPGTTRNRAAGLVLLLATALFTRRRSRRA